MSFEYEDSRHPPFCNRYNQNAGRTIPWGPIRPDAWNAPEKLKKASSELDDNRKRGIVQKLCSCFPSKFFEDFCNETSIHGFNHIVTPKRHFLEKLGWFLATFMAVVGAVLLCLQQWVRYDASPTVVALEKDYRSWNNSFIALTFCLAARYPENPKDYILKTWGVQEDDNAYKYYARFVEVVANATLLDLGGFEEFAEDANFKDVDLFQMAKDILPSTAVKLAWYDKTVNVSLVNVMTEMGLCQTVNSLVSRDQLVRLPKGVNNEPARDIVSCMYTTHPCYLRLEYTNVSVTFYSHSPYDMADVSSELLLTMRPGKAMDSNWKVLETKSTRDVRGLSVEHRNCRYHEEPISERYQVYSGSICRRICKSKISIKLCGCRPFFYFQEAGRACGPSGMACLSRHKQDLLQLPGCSCLPHCEDATYESISQKQSDLTGPFRFQSALKVFMLPPRSRYRRQILFYFEDLVVSFGGAAGLFLGFSFLSGVEIVYFVLSRLLSSLSGVLCRSFGGASSGRGGKRRTTSTDSRDQDTNHQKLFVFRKMGHPRIGLE